MKHRRQLSYWHKNLIWIRILLILWSVLALGGGVLWVKPLNRFHIGELPLGFWIAQQGAVIGFVCLVFVYAMGMAHLDNQHTQNKPKPPTDRN
ncbi:MAG: sodium/substrate symporter small subunit [Cyanobacteria bacterium J06555_13]